MQEKELRIALVCYGGVSLAVYMHGITKEVWRLANASQLFHAGAAADRNPQSDNVYYRLLSRIEQETDIELRVLVDILAGASAGGINAIFLSHAITTGRPLDPLTDLWLDSADIDKLMAPQATSFSRFAKMAAVPLAWALSNRSGTIDRTVEPAHRTEIRTKLANFVRARWFAPPFGGTTLTNLILDAFDAMDKLPDGPALLPDYQPLDLFVTVTDFHGFPQQLRLYSPAEARETEHRLTLSFRDPGGADRTLADPAELTYAARATASFPGAFPPFKIDELDAALKKRRRRWPTRNAFLHRIMPQHTELAAMEETVLIDGSVLANAPFRPAIAALESRPARREVDRRFVYIDPKPGMRSVRLVSGANAELPGFFTTIFGAMSDIPREQPIRDNLESIERLSARIRRLRHIVEAMRPEVEAAIEKAIGSTFFLERPNPKRLAAWRSRAHDLSALGAGYSYAAYAQLKIATVVEEVAAAIYRLGGGGDRPRRERVRQAIWGAIHAAGLTEEDAITARGARDDVIAFLRDFDLAFRTRRLRFVARRVTGIVAENEEAQHPADHVRRILHEMIGRYGSQESAPISNAARRPFADVEENPNGAMAALARIYDLRALDHETDENLTETLAEVPKRERRALILTYLGYPFYDVATLPLLQGEGLDEFDPIKVDRVSPEDAVAIRKGGVLATLKGIQFNSFGAFFSRAYRENDYLWGRLHGADRMIDIVLSALPAEKRLAPGTAKALKREAFRAILAEEKPRLTRIAPLFESLEREIG